MSNVMQQISSDTFLGPLGAQTTSLHLGTNALSNIYLPQDPQMAHSSTVTWNSLEAPEILAKWISGHFTLLTSVHLRLFSTFNLSIRSCWHNIYWARNSCRKFQLLPCEKLFTCVVARNFGISCNLPKKDKSRQRRSQTFSRKFMFSWCANAQEN
jgi:hypothetical protein